MKGKLTLVPSGPRPAPKPTSGAAIDPVCGMTVDPATAAGSHVHGGLTYWFCSTGCLERFRADPERYLAAGPDARAHAPAPSPAGRVSGYTVAILALLAYAFTFGKRDVKRIDAWAKRRVSRRRPARRPAARCAPLPPR